MFNLYCSKRKIYELLRHIWIPSLKWRRLADYNTEYKQAVPDDRKQGTGVRWVSTQKYHIIVRVEAMEFIQTSMTTLVVNINIYSGFHQY